MAETCICGERISPLGFISLRHKGFYFYIPNDSSRCPLCIERQTISDFEKYAEELIKLEGESVKVDWRSLLAKPPFEKDKIGNILTFIGILSFGSENNWEIGIDGPGGANIRIKGAYTYFTRLVDAVDVARLILSAAGYNWYVRQIGMVFTKEDVLRNTEKLQKAIKETVD
ncbi:MAG: hypothetical protein PHI53_03180 [Candidatus Pacebacteria bacterium]|nr:hypothetical protein [Candidatus Paceibacterota bacterium]